MFGGFGVCEGYNGFRLQGSGALAFQGAGALGFRAQGPWVLGPPLLSGLEVQPVWTNLLQSMDHGLGFRLPRAWGIANVD